ncbi:MAG TPA: hypothetical protein VEL03_11310 [Streptosporangiaceae bacterium]|nr:hypothetical protein [Streptosporangiaceae bacterium]
MDRAALRRVEQMVSEEVSKRFPGAPIAQVSLVAYGDDPAVEPGEILLRITIDTPGDKAGRDEVMDDFHRANRKQIRQLRDELAAKLPEMQRMEIRTAGTEPNVMRIRVGGPDRPLEARAAGAGDLTPVMARLAPADLETLDTLITAGIAPNRAEAVRWALARIRERPAYDALRDKTREIEELKSQF